MEKQTATVTQGMTNPYMLDQYAYEDCNEFFREYAEKTWKKIPTSSNTLHNKEECVNGTPLTTCQEETVTLSGGFSVLFAF